MINAVQIVDAWKEFFGNPTGALQGIIGSMYSLGAICSLPLVPVINDRFGRRWAIFTGSCSKLMPQFASLSYEGPLTVSSYGRWRSHPVRVQRYRYVPCRPLVARIRYPHVYRRRLFPARRTRLPKGTSDLDLVVQRVLLHRFDSRGWYHFWHPADCWQLGMAHPFAHASFAVFPADYLDLLRT